MLFTEHRDTLRYLQERITTLLGRETAVVVIHGSIGREERLAVQESFRHDPQVQVLLATDAAGEGINLQRAHLMVNYDLPWNPNRLEQRFGRIHGLAGVGEPGVEVAAGGVDAPVVGFDLDGDGGVDGLERGEPGHEPLLGDGLDGDDADASGPAALAFGDAVDLGEDALHLLEVGPPAVVESHAARPAVEQGDSRGASRACGRGGRRRPG